MNTDPAPDPLNDPLSRLDSSAKGLANGIQAVGHSAEKAAESIDSLIAKLSSYKLSGYRRARTKGAFGGKRKSNGVKVRK